MWVLNQKISREGDKELEINRDDLYVNTTLQSILIRKGGTDKLTWNPTA